MNLSKAIHARWAADSTLNDLLDSSKLVTGTHLADDIGAVWATVNFSGGPYVERYGNATKAVASPGVDFHVHHDTSYDTCKAIMDAVYAAFNNVDFSMDGADKVTMMRADVVPTEEQDPETGEWDFTASFTAQVYLPNGY